MKIFAGLIVLGGMMLGGTAQAAVVFDVNETATGISVAASGTFDKSLSMFNSYTSSYSSNGVIRAKSSRLNLGSGIGSTYSFNSALTLGTGETNNTITYLSGIMIGFTPGSFFIDNNYVSNSTISSLGVVSGKTLAAAGLSAGVYNYAIGGNSMTINIRAYVAPTPVITPDPAPSTGGPSPVAAVPEPATWALMMVGFGLVGGAARYRRRSIKAVIA